MKKRLNWRIISSNLAEAREQIEQIGSRIKHGKKPSEVELQIMLEHAYHHLNFAWHIRHEKTESYRHLTDENFNRWSKFPKEMKSSKI
jgi:hypothetical protein